MKTWLIRIGLGLLAVGLVVAISVGATLAVINQQKRAAEAPKKEEAKPEVGVLVQAGDYLTNLADPGSRTFIQVEVWLEVKDQATQQKFESVRVAFGDAALRLLRSKFRADLEGEVGLARLADDLKPIAERLLGPDTVLRVYFRRFVLQ